MVGTGILIPVKEQEKTPISLTLPRVNSRKGDQKRSGEGVRWGKVVKSLSPFTKDIGFWVKTVYPIKTDQLTKGGVRE